MTSDAKLTLSYPGSDVPDVETTWGEFVWENGGDEDLIQSVAEQIAADGYAEIGGGAAPVLWVFA